MQECIHFQMQVKKEIPKVMEFATEKFLNDKMKSYCDGDEIAIKQFDWWCSEYVTIDKIKGVIAAANDAHMYYDNLYILQDFVRDIAEKIPDAEFTGSMEKYNDDIGTEITITFEMKEGKLELEEVYPEGYDEDEEDCDEDEEDYDEEDEGAVILARMAKCAFKFENVDFDVAGTVYCKTVGDLLDYYIDDLTATEFNSEDSTLVIPNMALGKFKEFFPELIVSLMDEFDDFVLTGEYGTDVCFFAQYKNDVLNVSRRKGDKVKKAEYHLEDGTFDDEDGDDFDFFFD